MCGETIENKTERKCFKQTILMIEKSIEEGDKKIHKLFKQITK